MACVNLVTGNGLRGNRQRSDGLPVKAHAGAGCWCTKKLDDRVVLSIGGREGGVEKTVGKLESNAGRHSKNLRLD